MPAKKKSAIKAEVKIDTKKETKKPVKNMSQFWQIVAETAKTVAKQNDKQYSALTTSLKNQFREPYAMDIQVNGNNVKFKLEKASVIYDRAMAKDERYTFNDADYNPYVNAPMAIPPINYFNNLNSLVINNFFVGYGELTLIAQNPIISGICEIRADEIIGKWIRFTTTGKIDRTKEIEQLTKWYEDMKIKETFKQAIWWAFLFGGCMVYPSLKNVDVEAKGDEERIKPLMLDKLQVGKGDVQYFTVIEPIWYTAINWQAFNPLKRDFYKPEKYTVMGRITHATRLLHFKYKEVPDIIKPTYMFNGQPLSQELLPYLMGFEQSRNNINMLIAKYNHFVLKTNTEALLNDTDSLIAMGQNLGTRIALFNQIASANNVLAIDKELEEFENITLNLAGICDVQNQNMSYICSIAKIPIVKLFQNSLPGLNPTGEFETNSFYDTIRKDRANMVDQHHNTVLKLAQLDSFGEIYDDIGFEWEPLEVANELELSQIRLNKAQESVAYVGSGILHPLDVAKNLQANPDSGWEGIEIEESDYDTELQNPNQPNEREDGDDE